jgi:hypothetical protein
MTGFYTHNAPDVGDENDGLMPPGTTIADAFRRAASLLTGTTKRVLADPINTLLPLKGAVGGLLKEIPAYVSDLRNREPGVPGNSYFSAADPRQPTPDMSLAGRYVGPNDLISHNLIPAYTPRQDRQNDLRQDPLADLLGPMQQTPKPPPASGL